MLNCRKLYSLYLCRHWKEYKKSLILKEYKYISIEYKAYRTQTNSWREIPIRKHKLGGDRATYLTGRSEVDNFYNFHALWDFSSLLFCERHLHLGKGIYIPMLSVQTKISKYHTLVQLLRVLVLLKMVVLRKNFRHLYEKLGVISDLTRDS